MIMITIIIIKYDRENHMYHNEHYEVNDIDDTGYDDCGNILMIDTYCLIIEKFQ